MSIRPTLALTALLLATVSASVADEVTLTNGRTMRGEVLSKPGADPLVLKTPAGKVKLPRKLVKEVLRDRRPPARKEKAPRKRKEPRKEKEPRKSVPRDIPDELPTRGKSSLLKRVNPLPPKPTLPDATQLKALLAKGDPRSLTLAGIVYQDGRGVRYDHERAVPLYRRAAAGGDGLAMSRLAVVYLSGYGVDQDRSLGKEWALAAAQAQDPYGLALVAAWGWGVSNYSRQVAAERHLQAALSGDTRSYYFVAKYKGIGKGFPRDEVDAARWHARGAELGQPGCMDRHASNLAYGTGVPRNLVAARRWAKLAWSHGDGFGAVKYATALRLGWGGAPAPTEAIKILKSFLERNKTEASGLAFYQLGQTYRLGWGTAVDFKKARDYLTLALELGYEESVPALGYMLYKGQGGEKDLAMARKLWELGAENDNTWSIQNLAYRAREGAWAPKDPAKARALFLRAARLGDSVSMYELGCMVFHGKGGAADHAEGVRWLEKAAEKGNAAAAREVGRCYTEGWLGTKDLPRARRAYRLAAQAGDLDGVASYAWMLARGNGGPADPATARRLLEQGVAKKHAHSTYLLGRLLCGGTKGFSADPVRAKSLLKQAQSLGSEVAKAELRARGW